jgi:hypothetical protein
MKLIVAKQSKQSLGYNANENYTIQMKNYRMQMENIDGKLIFIVYKWRKLLTCHTHLMIFLKTKCSWYEGIHYLENQGFKENSIKRKDPVPLPLIISLALQYSLVLLFITN